MKIYTKTGDAGTTSLLGGKRVHKFDIRIDAIGSLDELNASIGVVISFLDGIKYEDVNRELKNIQNDLFNMGAELAVPSGTQLPSQYTYTLEEDKVTDIEKLIDFYDKELKPLNEFILPGGTKVSSLLHLSRTIARKAEREVVLLSIEESINENILKYLNRVSDLFFVLARFVNQTEGTKDILWNK